MLSARHSLALTAIFLCLAATQAEAQARGGAQHGAQDGAWKVGSTYVVRFENLDLSSPPDRARLLAQIERSASKLCEGVRTRAKRQACAAATVKSALSAAPELAATLHLARLERDGQQQAQR
jgi:UrcA family protein